MNRMSEWKDLYDLGMGMSTWFGPNIEAVRVPGGVIYRNFEEKINSNTEYFGGGGSNIRTEENITVSITFAPFPAGLYEKLSQL